MLVTALLVAGGVSGAAVAQTGPGGVGTDDGTSDLRIWLQADELSANDGDAIPTWPDASGYGNAASQSTASNQPTYKPSALSSGGAAVVFDGSDDLLTFPQQNYYENLDGRDLTAFVVTEIEQSITQNQGILSNYLGSSLNPQQFWAVFASGSDGGGDDIRAFVRRDDGAEDVDPTGGSLSQGTTKIVGFRKDGTTIRALENGANAASGTLSQEGATDNNFRLGMGSHFGRHLQYDVAEVALYSKAINAAERTIVENYLSTKHGVSITGDKYAYDASQGNDVAGIGQASDGSQHLDAKSNALRLRNPQGLSNGDFLLFGHDGAGIGSFTTTEVPSNLSKRVAREWRVDESSGDGDVGNLTVQIDANDLPSPNSGSSYFALVDGDGDFTTTGDQSRTRLTLDSGSIYDASGIDPADGDYVTLAVGARPKTPQNLTAESDLNQEVALSWDEVSLDRTGSPTTLTGDTYRIYQNTSSSFSGATQVATSSNESATITGLTNGTQYYFWVTAVNDAGESDEQSTPANATPALRVSFANASSVGSETNGGASGFDVELSDTHGQAVTFELTATASARSAASVTIQNGGTGYAVGEVIENDNPNGGNLQLEVTSVNNGAVTGVDITNAGSGYTSAPAQTDFNTIDGNGTGAEFSVTLQSAGADYTLTSTTFSVSANNPSVTLDASDLSFNNDNIPENTESVQLTLSDPNTNGAAATLGGQTTHTVSIQDDDFQRNVFLVDGLDTADDGTSSDPEENTVTYTVETDDVDNVNDTRVDYQIDMSASATTADSADFTIFEGAATIPSGNSSATFDLPIRDDNKFENNEDVVVRLTRVTNANLDDNPGSTNPTNGRYTSLTHTIENSADTQPQVRFASATSSVPDEQTPPSIQVDLTGSTSGDVSVDLAATGGTASGSGDDYTLTTTTVTIPDGETSVTLDGTDLAVVDDAIDENDETVELTLQDNTVNGDATVDTGNNTHTFTITDDDPAPAVTFRNPTSSALEPAGSATIPIDLSTTSERDVTVNYDASGIALGGGTDYTDNSGGSVTITAGNSSKTINLSLTDDKELEGDETITFSFAGEDLTNGQTGGTTSHTFTLRDDDVGSTGPAGVGTVDGTSSLRIWLDARDLSVGDGNPVSTWADGSGYGNDATQSTGSNQPIYDGDALASGDPAVAFDGTDDVLQFPDRSYYENLDGRDLTAYVVAEVEESVSSNTGILTNYTGTSPTPDQAWGLFADGGNALRVFVRRDDNSETLSETGGSIAQGATKLVGIRKKGTTIQGLEDGTQVASGTLSQEGTTENTNYQLGLGRHFDRNLQFDVAEVVLFTSALNTTNRTLIANYLAAKHSFALDTGGGAKDVYAGDQGGNGDYDRGVFGVGRESSTDLHTAAETDGLRVESTGGLGDGDYLVAGHRVAENSVLSSGSVQAGNVSLEARSERTWYVDETDGGTALTADVTFDLAAAGLAGPAGGQANYVLLQRTAESGTPPVNGGWTAISASDGLSKSVSKNRITFEDANLDSGTEITLGTTDAANSPLDTGNLVVTGTAGADGEDQGWRYLGLPATGGTANSLERLDGSTFINFGVEWMAYTNPGGDLDDTNPGWDPLKSGEALTNGRGFILWLYDNSNYPLDPSITLRLDDGLSGPGTGSNVTVGSGNAGDPALAGSNDDFLLANPYAAAFGLGDLYNAGAGSVTGDDFKTAVQIWRPNATVSGNDPDGQDDANKGTWLTRSRDTDDAIASWQGFILSRSASGDEQVQFHSAGAPAGTTPPFVGSKAKDDESTRHRIPLRLVVQNEQGRTVAQDRAASVLFHEAATPGEDQFDAPKFEPMAAPFATVAPVTPGGETPHAQESRPLPGDDTVAVPVEVRTKGISGTFRLSVPNGGEASTETPSIPDDWTVRLIDTKGTADPADDDKHRLTPGGPAYTVDLDAKSTKARRTAAKTTASAADTTTSGPPAPPPLRRIEQSTTERHVKASAPTDASKAADAPPTRFKLRVMPGSDESGSGDEGTTPALATASMKAAVVGASGKSVRLTWTLDRALNGGRLYVERQRLPLNDTSAVPQQDQWKKEKVGRRAKSKKAPKYSVQFNHLDYGRHAFRLRKDNPGGGAAYSETIEKEIRLGGAYDVTGPYPNPVSQRATLEIRVRDEQSLRVQLYDLLGRHIRTIYTERLPARETTQIRFDAGRLSSGSYFMRVKGEEFTVTRRMTVIR